MEGRIADPKALGFGAFAIGAWMYSMIDAGWFAMSTYGSGTSQAVGAFAAVALLVAAIAAFLRDDGWHALFFAFWAAVFWGFSGVLDMAGGDPTYAGWHSLTIAVFNLLLLLSARRSGVDTPGVAVSGGVTVAFLCWAAAGILGVDALTMVGGYLGLATAVAGFWAASAGMPGGVAAAGGGAEAPTASSGRAPGAGGTM